MINFAVVGLGMRKTRARMIKKTEGASLKCVVDLNRNLPKQTGDELETGWTTNLHDALGRAHIRLR